LPHENQTSTVCGLRVSKAHGFVDQPSRHPTRGCSGENAVKTFATKKGAAAAAEQPVRDNIRNLSASRPTPGCIAAGGALLAIMALELAQLSERFAVLGWVGSEATASWLR